MNKVESSVVQIITDHSIPNWETPWVKTKKYRSYGSGFCIKIGSKKYILTNTHCVLHAFMVKGLLKSSGSSGFALQVVAILYECDLALLEAVSPENLKDVEPLRFRKLPNKLEKVYVVGYPLGGHNISITEGVVNRVVMIPYMNVVNGISIQIDAAINFGNSGGPVVDKDGNVVGVAFATEDLMLADNMGYMIPTALVNFFISSFIRGAFKTGKFIGLCKVNINTQFMHNTVLRKIFKLPPKTKGILITQADDSAFKEYDIITHIEHKPINNDGTMRVADIIQLAFRDVKIDVVDSPGNALETGEVLPWTNLTGLLYPGQVVSCDIIRDGKSKNVKTKLAPRHFNIPQIEYQADPRYWTIMGMVFVPLTYMLIDQLNKAGKYTGSLEGYASTHITRGNEYVVLTDIYTTEFTEGFPQENFIVDTVNDYKILNLDHLKTLIDGFLKKSESIIFTFKDTPKIAVLDSADVKKYSDQISATFLS